MADPRVTHLEELCRVYRAALHAADAAEEHVETARMARRAYDGEALPKAEYKFIKDTHARAVDAAQELREALESLTDAAHRAVRGLQSTPEPISIRSAGPGQLR